MAYSPKKSSRRARDRGRSPEGRSKRRPASAEEETQPQSASGGIEENIAKISASQTPANPSARKRVSRLIRKGRAPAPVKRSGKDPMDDLNDDDRSLIAEPEDDSAPNLDLVEEEIEEEEEEYEDEDEDEDDDDDDDEDEDEDEDDDEEDDEDDDEEEEEEEPAPRSRSKTRSGRRSSRLDRTEKVMSPAARSGRGSRRDGINTRSSRLKNKQDDEDAPNSSSSRNSRRSTRGSFRDRPEPKPVISKKQKIIGGLVGVLALAAFIAYKPVMKSMHISTLETGASLTEKKASAKAIFTDFEESALQIFEERTRGQASEETHQAAFYGLALFGKSPAGKNRSLFINSMERIIGKGESAERIAATKALYVATKNAVKKEQTSTMKELLPILMSRIDEEEESEARLLAIKGVGLLPIDGGGCTKLIGIAIKEKGAARKAALAGIASSAMPDAVEALLLNMVNEEDQALATATKTGFAKVRNEAKTSQLLPQLGHKSDAVRLEIVKALASRKGDSEAIKGILKSLGDVSPGIRIESVLAVPSIGAPLEELTKLKPLISDSDAGVQIATAQALARLRDEPTWKILLKAFENNITGKVIDAYIGALASRGKARNKKKGRKDVASIAIVMKSLDKNPGSAKAIGQALVQLTLARGYPGREVQRKSWKVDQWKSWFKTLERRDNIEKQALKLLIDADKQKQGSKDKYAQLYKDTQEGLELLEKCKDLCKPNDPEDVWIYDGKIKKFQMNSYFFQKHQTLNLRR